MVLAPRQPTWNDRIIATGRQVGDRVVWRFSFADGIDAVKIQLSDGSDHVVEVKPGRRGTWFEHSADVDMVMEGSGRLPSMEIITAGSPLLATQ